MERRMKDIARLIDPVVALAEEAGRAILAVYETDFSVREKDDSSPLTQADLASHRCITAGLRVIDPKTPILSEEGGMPDFAERSRWTARRNSSTATANSPSTSPASGATGRYSGSFTSR
jgi:3'(2'), 5'-bisphosphate nucleotidase